MPAAQRYISATLKRENSTRPTDKAHPAAAPCSAKTSGVMRRQIGKKMTTREYSMKSKPPATMQMLILATARQWGRTEQCTEQLNVGVPGKVEVDHRAPEEPERVVQDDIHTDSSAHVPDRLCAGWEDVGMHQLQRMLQALAYLEARAHAEERL
eukprot:scaffold57151_cov62-Phaeocystis_antarctica.AAC.2